MKIFLHGAPYKLSYRSARSNFHFFKKPSQLATSVEALAMTEWYSRTLKKSLIEHAKTSKWRAQMTKYQKGQIRPNVRKN